MYKLKMYKMSEIIFVAIIHFPNYKDAGKGDFMKINKKFIFIGFGIALAASYYARPITQPASAPQARWQTCNNGKWCRLADLDHLDGGFRLMQFYGVSGTYVIWNNADGGKKVIFKQSSNDLLSDITDKLRNDWGHADEIYITWSEGTDEPPTFF